MSELKNDYYNLSFILSRVLNSGIIMSIEKNEKEIPGLEKKLQKICSKKYASTFNSYTGALHAISIAYSSGYGDTLNIENPTYKEKKFLEWLGIKSVDQEAKFTSKHLNFNNLKDISMIEDYESVILNFTDLGFGSASIILTDSQEVYEISEKLKIFGSYDLRTMWTQKRDESHIEPGIQFNYRLSPLVAACVKMSLIRGVK